MADNPRLGLLDELLAERFGPVTSPTPAIRGGTHELVRRIDLCDGDDLADVIDFPTRNVIPAVTSSCADALTQQRAASQ